VTLSVLTEAAVYDVSKWDEAKWPGPESAYDKLIMELDAETVPVTRSAREAP